MDVSKLKSLNSGSKFLLMTSAILVLAATILALIWMSSNSMTAVAVLLLSVFGASCFALGCLWAIYIKLRNYIQKIEKRQSDQLSTIRKQAEGSSRGVEDAKLALASEAHGLYAEIDSLRKTASKELSSESIRVRNEIKRVRKSATGELAEVKTRVRKVEADALVTRRDNLKKILLLAERAEDCSGLFSRADLKLLASEIDECDPFLIYWLYNQYEAFDILDISSRRNLATSLRQRGYLEMSQKVFSAVVGETMSDQDLFAFEQRQSELEIYRDGYCPKIAPGTGNISRLPQNVLHVVGKSLPKTQSGYTLRTHYTAMAQRDAGLHVSVVNQVGESADSNQQTLDIVDGIAYYSLPGLSRLELTWEDWLDQNIHELARVVQRVRPSLLHAHSDFFNAVSAQAVGAHFNIPVVYESRGFWEESWLSRISQKFDIEEWADLEKMWGMPEAYYLRKHREEAARNASARVFTLARVMENHIVQAGYEPSRISRVPNAVSVEDFPVVNRDHELAAELGYSDDTLVIGYISSIVEYEGIDTLIEAYHALGRTVDKNVRLLLVGDGAFTSTLKRMIEEMGATGITFTGSIKHEEVLRYYSLIDIFVVPRRPAQVCHLVTPLKPFEAFSTGRAVVMSNVDALKEIAEDSGAAELFEAGDAHSLLQVLHELVQDDDRRGRLSEKGAKWVRQERTWNVNAKKYLEVYSELGVQPEDPDARITETHSDYRSSGVRHSSTRLEGEVRNQSQ